MRRTASRAPPPSSVRRAPTPGSRRTPIRTGYSATMYSRRRWCRRHRPTGPGGVCMPIRDLREWLGRVSERGELLRIREPVDIEEEMSAMVYLVAKQGVAPAMLFENPRGYENSPFAASLLWNLLGASLP